MLFERIISTKPNPNLFLGTQLTPFPPPSLAVVGSCGTKFCPMQYGQSGWTSLEGWAHKNYWKKIPLPSSMVHLKSHPVKVQNCTSFSSWKKMCCTASSLALIRPQKQELTSVTGDHWACRFFIPPQKSNYVHTTAKMLPFHILSFSGMYGSFQTWYVMTSSLLRLLKYLPVFSRTL